MRVPFDRVFIVFSGKIIPLEPVKIGDVTIAGSMVVPPSCLLLGVQIGKLIGCDLEVRREANVTIIQGFYLDNTLPQLAD
jgi:hypothetical protein